MNFSSENVLENNARQHFHIATRMEDARATVRKRFGRKLKKFQPADVRNIHRERITDFSEAHVLGLMRSDGQNRTEYSGEAFV